MNVQLGIYILIYVAHKDLTTVVTDIAVEVQEQINAYFDELITKNPYGLVVSHEGYLTLSKSSYV